MRGYMDIIKPDRTIVHKEYTSAIPLKDLQDAVGGFIEVVPYFQTYHKDGKKFPCVAWCNEDGKGQELEGNSAAHILWCRAVGRMILDDFLVGNIAITWGDDEFMETL